LLPNRTSLLLWLSSFSNGFHFLLPIYGDSPFEIYFLSSSFLPFSNRQCSFFPSLEYIFSPTALLLVLLHHLFSHSLYFCFTSPSPFPFSSYFLFPTTHLSSQFSLLSLDIQSAFLPFSLFLSFLLLLSPFSLCSTSRLLFFLFPSYNFSITFTFFLFLPTFHHPFSTFSLLLFLSSFSFSYCSITYSLLFLYLSASSSSLLSFPNFSSPPLLFSTAQSHFFLSVLHT
jgi:hypothetical protein